MDELFEKKWKVFAKRVRLFRLVPFVEFVMLSGSMVTDTLREDSDFDLIIGVRRGRIFTAWFLSSALYELFRWRETPDKPKNNMIGLGHFAAPEGYELSEPRNAYWQHLYMNVIPALGDEEKLAQFFDANVWMEPKRNYERHEKYLGSEKSIIKSMLEFVLSRWLGDRIESVLKKRLTARIERQLPEKTGHKPRVKYGDDRLEFYRDTKRIEMMLEMRQFRID